MTKYNDQEPTSAKNISSRVRWVIEINRPLPEQFAALKLLVDEKVEFDFSTLDITVLQEQFNAYVETLAEQMEAFNLLNHEKANQNILVAHAGLIDSGNAFLAQYRESTLLRRKYCLSPKGETRPIVSYTQPSQAYREKNPGSIWDQVCQVLDTGSQIVATLRCLQENDPRNTMLYQTCMSDLKNHLQNFENCKTALSNSLEGQAKLGAENNFESKLFYPFTEDDLKKLSGNQLLILCFEEINTSKPSSIIVDICNNTELWDKMTESYRPESFISLVDKSDEKYALLEKWHSLAEQFHLIKEYFNKEQEIATKKDLFLKLQSFFNVLPDFFQKKENDSLESAKQQLSLLHEDYEKKETAYQEALEIFSQARDLLSKENSFAALTCNYNALPEKKEPLRHTYQAAEETLANWKERHENYLAKEASI